MAKEQHWRKIGIGETCRQGELEGVRWWLQESKKAHIGIEDLLIEAEIRTAFKIACEFRHLDIVKLIHKKSGVCLEEIIGSIYVHDRVVDYLLETDQWQNSSDCDWWMSARGRGRKMERKV